MLGFAGNITTINHPSKIRAFNYACESTCSRYRNVSIPYLLINASQAEKVKLKRINGSKEQKVWFMPLGDNYAIITSIFVIEYDAKKQVQHIFISPCICIYAEHWFTVIWYQDIFLEHCILQMLNNFRCGI